MEAAITVLTESRTIACALPAAVSTALIDVLLYVSRVTDSQLAPITLLVLLPASIHSVAFTPYGRQRKRPRFMQGLQRVFRALQTLPPLARD